MYYNPPTNKKDRVYIRRLFHFNVDANTCLYGLKRYQKIPGYEILTPHKERVKQYYTPYFYVKDIPKIIELLKKIRDEFNTFRIYGTSPSSRLLDKLVEFYSTYCENTKGNK